MLFVVLSFGTLNRAFFPGNSNITTTSVYSSLKNRFAIISAW